MPSPPMIAIFLRLPRGRLGRSAGITTSRLQRLVDRHVLELVGSRDGPIRHVAAVRVDAEEQRAITLGRGDEALVRDRDRVADRRVS